MWHGLLLHKQTKGHSNEMNSGQKPRRIKKITRHPITKEQFLAILNKAAQPIKDWQQSDSTSGQTLETGHSDGYDEKHTRSNKTEGI